VWLEPLAEKLLVDDFDGLNSEGVTDEKDGERYEEDDGQCPHVD